ncbi:hypothetical protein SH611_14410 [Geminicoccaceae bacterium 1502E]|nr:hypothetical protein [Geminicoccaceae bacterium 1502E]
MKFLPARFIDIVVPFVCIIYVAMFFLLRESSAYVLYVFSWAGLAAVIAIGFLQEAGVWPFRKTPNKTRWPFMVVLFPCLLAFSAAWNDMLATPLAWTLILWFAVFAAYGILFHKRRWVDIDIPFFTFKR